MYKFVHELSKKNILFLNCWYGYLKESPPSGELINVVNADGGVVPPVLIDADLEPSEPHDRFTV